MVVCLQITRIRKNRCYIDGVLEVASSGSRQAVLHDAEGITRSIVATATLPSTARISEGLEGDRNLKPYCTGRRPIICSL